MPLDESLCEQVFVNLIQNAYEAMGASGGDCGSRRPATRNDGEPGWSRSADRRYRTGNSAELREQIFNPFVTTKKTGVGLGLSIVSKIIDGHHGTIQRRGWR